MFLFTVLPLSPLVQSLKIHLIDEIKSSPWHYCCTWSKTSIQTSVSSSAFSSCSFVSLYHHFLPHRWLFLHSYSALSSLSFISFGFDQPSFPDPPPFSSAPGPSSSTTTPLDLNFVREQFTSNSTSLSPLLLTKLIFFPNKIFIHTYGQIDYMFHHFVPQQPSQPPDPSLW